LESVEYHQHVYVDAFKLSLWLGCPEPSVLFYVGVKLFVSYSTQRTYEYIAGAWEQSAVDIS